MNRLEQIDKLARSPLALVVGQVRFPMIPKLADKIEDIYEDLCDIGLDRQKPEIVQQFTFGSEVTSTKVNRWVFSNRDRTESVFLTHDFIVLAQSNYEIFESFSRRLIEATEVVRKHARAKYFEQLGLRYLNLLQSIDDLLPEQLIADGLRGIPANILSAKESLSQSVVRCQTDVGTLTLRCLELVGPGFLPPDLRIEEMKFPREPKESERFRLLDIDNISSFHASGDFDSLSDSLWKLHEHTSLGFNRSVTEKALEAWRKST